MQWLIANMWMAMAAATVLGLLFGFAFRGILVGSRIRKAEVEREVAKTELTQSKAEVEELYAAQRKQREETAETVSNDDSLRAEIEERDRQIVALGDALTASQAQIERLESEATETQNGFVAAGAAAVGAVAGAALSDDHEAELTQLRDRNAWLEERVGALESDISSMQSAPKVAAAQETEADRILAEKAAWKAAYLDSRVEALEEKLIAQTNAAPTEDPKASVEDVIAPRVEPETPSKTDLDEELANLRWRNRYLEGRLAYFEEKPEDAAEAEELAGDDSESDEAPEPDAAPEPEDAVTTEVADQADVSDEAEETSLNSEEDVTETEVQDDVAEALEDADEADEKVHPSDAILAQLDGIQPVQISRPKDGGDDLTKITGIGPRIGEVLNGLGIWTFAQIADWEPENETWVENHLSFKGRVSRENWVGQAKAFLVEA